MTTSTVLYQPDTESPDLAHVADMVRNLMAQGQYPVKYVTDRSALLTDEPELADQTLDIKRAWGPAPWAGKPYIYLWDVAVGGRSWIAGPTRIQPTTLSWP